MEYAKTVDRAYCGGTLHTSFQIRLPYVKGMLHQVDFKEFLSCAGMKTITDLWGTVHDVANVDIILTKSMIQFIRQLPRQLESAEKAIQRQCIRNCAFVVYQPQHQLPLRLIELLPQQIVICLHRLLQRRQLRLFIKVIVQCFQYLVHGHFNT